MTTDEPRPPADGERVRFCLSCGAVVPFEERSCPSCGQVDPGSVGDQDMEQVVFCLACGGDVPVGLCFCTHCGRPLVPPDVPWPDRPPGAASRTEESGGRRAEILAWVGPALLTVALARALGVV